MANDLRIEISVNTEARDAIRRFGLAMSDVQARMGDAFLPVLATLAGVEIGERTMLHGLDGQSLLGRDWEEWDRIFTEPEFSGVWEDYDLFNMQVKLYGRYTGRRFNMMRRLSRHHMTNETQGQEDHHVLVREAQRCLQHALHDFGPAEVFAFGDLIINGHPFRVARSTLSTSPRQLDYLAFHEFGSPIPNFVGSRTSWELDLDIETGGPTENGVLVSLPLGDPVDLQLRVGLRRLSGNALLSSLRSSFTLAWPPEAAYGEPPIGSPMTINVVFSGTGELRDRELRSEWDAPNRDGSILRGHMHSPEFLEQAPQRQGRRPGEGQDWNLRSPPTTVSPWGTWCAPPQMPVDTRAQTEAKEKALALLNSGLTEEQRESYAESKDFTVISQSGEKFLISKGKVQNITRLSDGNTFCISFEDNSIPVEDLLLAQAVMLTTNEKEFYEIANEFDGQIMNLVRG